MARISSSSLVVAAALMTTTELFAFPSSRLVYARGEGAESCPSEPSLREAVARRLGYDPFFPAAERTLIARIARDRDELLGRIELVDDAGFVRGAREFRIAAQRCDDLVAIMALAISIAIDPTSDAASAPRVEPDPPESEVRAPTPAPERRPALDLKERAAASPKVRAPSTRSSPLEPRAGLSLTTSLGTAPNAALGASVSLGVRWRSVSLHLEGRHDWVASVAVPTGGAAGTSLWLGGVAPCFHGDPWFFCGVVSIGSMRASGDGLVQSRTGNASYQAAGGRVGLEIPLAGPVFFRPELDLVAHLTRLELRVDGAPVWSLPPFSVQLGAGVLGTFR
jgi:hypothetical protein